MMKNMDRNKLPLTFGLQVQQQKKDQTHKQNLVFEPMRSRKGKLTATTVAPKNWRVLVAGQTHHNCQLENFMFFSMSVSMLAHVFDGRTSLMPSYKFYRTNLPTASATMTTPQGRFPASGADCDNRRSIANIHESFVSTFSQSFKK